MENIIDTSASSGLTLSDETVNHLEQTRKWTMFLSIMGFIFIGFIVIAAIFVPATFASRSAFGQVNDSVWWVTVVYLFIAALYFFPVYFLFKFSSNMKNAIAYRSSESLSVAIHFQKRMYQFVGILTIIFLAFWLLLMLIGLGASL